MMCVEFMKNFPLADSYKLMALSPKTLDSVHQYVEFMKNFLLPDSSELMAVRLFSVL